MEALGVVADKLKIIRNGTHFHIDSRGVLDPRAIWSGASLSGKELSEALEFGWGALCEAQATIGGNIPPLMEYTSEGALAALRRIDGIG